MATVGEVIVAVDADAEARPAPVQAGAELIAIVEADGSVNLDGD